MNPSVDQLLEAYRRGHAWNSAYPNLANLDEGRIRSMDGSERDAKDLMASRQSIDANMDKLVDAFHSRLPQFDGDVGPATEALLKLRRCPLPDHPPPPGAQFHFDDPELQAIVESMQEAAQVERSITGPYWRECDPQRKGIHSLVIGIDAERAPSVFKENQAHILAERTRIAAEIGVAVRFIINPQSMDGLQQYQVYKPIAGGVIGMNYFPQSNSCGRIPNGSMDSTYNPSNVRLHISLGTHESEGHGFGFNHTRGGIMNPSIIDSELTWVGDSAWSQVTRYYPAKPLDDMPIPPGPVPPTNLPTFEPLVLTLPSGQRVRYNLVPWPEV